MAFLRISEQRQCDIPYVEPPHGLKAGLLRHLIPFSRSIPALCRFIVLRRTVFDGGLEKGHNPRVTDRLRDNQVSPFPQDIEQTAEAAGYIRKTIKGGAANDMVEGSWRHWKRCHVAHEQAASRNQGPRLQQVIDGKIEADYFLIPLFQGRKQNAGSAAAIEHGVSRARSEALEDRPIVPFMVILCEVEAVSEFLLPDQRSLQLNLFQYTRQGESSSPVLFWRRSREEDTRCLAAPATTAPLKSRYRGRNR